MGKRKIGDRRPTKMRGRETATVLKSSVQQKIETLLLATNKKYLAFHTLERKIKVERKPKGVRRITINWKFVPE